MQPFRVHGLVASEPAPGPVPCFGRRSARRYGRRTSHRDTPQRAPALADDDAFPWVDQEFEEYFFE